MLNYLRFIHFGDPKQHYKVVILIKEDGLHKEDILKHYINPISEGTSFASQDFLAVNLLYDGKKAKVNEHIKPWLTYLSSLVTADYWYVADSAYYKILTKTTKVTHSYGSIVDCVFDGFKDSKAILSVNHRAIFFDTKNQDKINLSNRALSADLNGNKLFEDIVHTAYFPKSLADIEAQLTSLLEYPLLACDIEGFSLKHYKAGIGTISFAWSQHEGCAFAVDYMKLNQSTGKYSFKNIPIHKMLSDFFYEYLVTRKHTLIWHNISYDVKVLIWELMMKGRHINKQEMLVGLEMFTNNQSFEDTKIIAYLATNSCDGNELGLKSLALPFAGNYALNDDEITDISKVPLDDLLNYNLIDTLSTFYVYNTYYPKLIADNQLKPYEEIFKPSVKVLMQAELHGMPLNMVNVYKAEKELQTLVNAALKRILNNKYIVEFTQFMRSFNYIEKHNQWKTKTAPLDDSAFNFTFNPNSSQQLVSVLHDMLELPVLDYTKTKQPSVGNDTLKKLINHTNDQDIKNLIKDVREHGKAIKVLTSFIPAFKDAYKCPDTGYYYLMGNFNIGGTVSGRLSSSNPNLQNIPSGSEYAKLVKECFMPQSSEWIMVGLDFNSLEDYISALTTKDPNKLKVYTDKYDGHCLRAFSYFPDRLPDIEDTVESINSIKNKYPDVRQDSKAPTFALTYQGTWLTLMKNCGFSEDLAKQIEANFQTLYATSIEYINAKLQQASVDGYVEVAFGLRVRTPLIHKSVWGTSFTPKEALAEGRTAGNACGQSYGLLNNRAGIEFQQRTLNSQYALDIWPIAHIHDAQYFIVRKSPEVIAWMNKELVECVQWQELPEIQHDTVKLGGELSVFHPSWANEMVIPNGIHDAEGIRKVLKEKYAKYKKEKLSKA